MKYIQFPGFEFDAKKLKSRVTKPEAIISKIVLSIMPSLPDEVSVKEYANTVAVSLGNKKMNISAWEFSLSGEYQKGLKPLIDNKEQNAIVFCIQFISDGKFRSDLNPLANIKCALGYKTIENKMAQFIATDHARQLALALQEEAIAFFSGSSIDQTIAELLPKGTKFKVKTATEVQAEVPYKDITIDILSVYGRMTATVYHVYDDTDRAYGSKYHNAKSTHNFTSVSEVKDFDFEAMFADLYERRHGEMYYKGSLGT